jgi:hypothetical protein
MNLRRAVRIAAGTAVALYVWAAMSTVTVQAPGWPWWGLSAGVLVAVIAVLLCRRRTA